VEVKVADRLINENAVLALIDARIAAAQRLQTSPLCRPVQRRELEGVVNAMQRLTDEVKALDDAEYTEGDIARMFSAANDADREDALAVLQEVADVEGWEARS
jgi:hypothetical protein